MNGKGSTRRPRQVERGVFESNWERTFAPKKTLGEAFASGYARMLPVVEGSDYWNRYYGSRRGK